MSAPPSARRSAPTPKPSSATVGAADAGAAAPRRHDGADALKALAIAGVVFIHADGLYAAPAWFHRMLADVFRFGVPIFVALYVHFASRAIDKRSDGAAYLRNRFGRLLLQFMCWSALYAALTADWPTLTPIKFLTRHWTGNGWAGQFYFIVVLQLTLLMPWLISTGRWFAARPGWLIGGSLTFFIGLVYPPWSSHPLVQQLNDRPFVYWLPHAWLGVAWFGRATVSYWAARGLLAATVLLIPIEAELVAAHDVVDSPYLMPSVFVAATALLRLAGDASAPGVRWPAWIGRPVSLLAANTLGIFVLNPLVILLLHRALAPVVPSGTGTVAAVLLPLTATAVVLAIALALTLALKRSPIGRRLVV